jgi:hypothetical protein
MERHGTPHLVMVRVVDRQGEDLDAAFSAGTGAGELEASLLDVFRRHVRPDMTADDDFFAAGGVSLTAAMCVAELRKGGIPVSLRELFRQKTARRLAATLSAV